MIVTKSEVAGLVAIAIAAFPQYQERDMKLTVQAWHQLLADIPFEAAKAALIKLLTTIKYFPTIAELREAALRCTTSLPTPEEAWEEVRGKLSGDTYIKLKYKNEKPQFSCPEIEQAVNQLGLEDLLMSENISYDRTQFLRFYETIRNRAIADKQEQHLAELTKAQKLLPGN